MNKTTNKIYLISSVLGFNFNTELYDTTGNLVLSGTRTIYQAYSGDLPKIGIKLPNKKWFTNYNQDLIDKIRDFRRIND